MEAVLEVIRKRLGSMPDAERRALVEDIHHPITSMSRSSAAAHRDYTNSDLERFKR